MRCKRETALGKSENCPHFIRTIQPKTSGEISDGMKFPVKNLENAK